MIDDIPEEDKWLKQEIELSNPAIKCSHEYEYLGTGFKRGDPTISVVWFFCKYCTNIKQKTYDQSIINLNYDDEMTDFRDKL